MKRSLAPTGVAHRIRSGMSALLLGTAAGMTLLPAVAEGREAGGGPVQVLRHAAAAGEPDAAPASPPPAAWTWPVGGAQQRSVGRRFDPPVTRYGAGHRGVDLVAQAGAPVVAAAAGQVTYAGLLAGRGVVVVDHGALRTTYEPVAAAVQVGAQVGRGAAIGSLEPGHEGCPQAACLHWGLRRGDGYLDPLSVLDAGPVRLLPLDPAPAEPGTGLAGGGSGGWDGPAGPPPATRGPAAEPATAGPGQTQPAVRLTGATASSALAALALLAALLALRRAGRRPDPSGGAAAAAVPSPAMANPPVDLAAERDRRRPVASAASGPAVTRPRGRGRWQLP